MRSSIITVVKHDLDWGSRGDRRIDLYVIKGKVSKKQAIKTLAIEDGPGVSVNHHDLDHNNLHLEVNSIHGAHGAYN